jgi:hypothetical protein
MSPRWGLDTKTDSPTVGRKVTLTLEYEPSQSVSIRAERQLVS